MPGCSYATLGTAIDNAGLQDYYSSYIISRKTKINCVFVTIKIVIMTMNQNGIAHS